MSGVLFPVLGSLATVDSRQFQIEREDPAMRTEMEGGYVISRKKHTRAPRRTFTVVYRLLNAADKILLDNFWDQVGGGSTIFDWTNPQDNVVYEVRFLNKMVLTYVGRGTTQQWDCSMTLEQA